MLWTSGYYSATYIRTLFEAQWILSNLFAAGHMLLVMACWGRFCGFKTFSCWVHKNLTPMWWVVVIQVSKVLHEKLRVAAASSSTNYYPVKNLKKKKKKKVGLCESNVILDRTVLWNPCWGLGTWRLGTCCTGTWVWGLRELFNECKYWQEHYQKKLSSDLLFTSCSSVQIPQGLSQLTGEDRVFCDT